MTDTLTEREVQPFPWRVGFNGTIATVHDARGRSVSWATVERAFDKLTAAQAEIAALRGDAERWRYARTHPEFLGWDTDYLPDAVDAAIDSARKG